MKMKADQKEFQNEVLRELQRFERRHEKVEKALSVTAYYAAFAGILQWTKFANVMSLIQEEWKKLKSLSQRIKGEANEKVRRLLGEGILEELEG